jgi:hypothetical protein
VASSLGVLWQLSFNFTHCSLILFRLHEGILDFLAPVYWRNKYEQGPSRHQQAERACAHISFIVYGTVSTAQVSQSLASAHPW